MIMTSPFRELPKIYVLYDYFKPIFDPYLILTLTIHGQDSERIVRKYTQVTTSPMVNRGSYHPTKPNRRLRRPVLERLDSTPIKKA